MKKYRVQFEIDEVVQAENSEDAINEVIGKAIGGYWFDNELTQYIRGNADIEDLEDEEEQDQCHIQKNFCPVRRDEVTFYEDKKDGD